MVTYHLCRQSDGRIVLDREVCGAVLDTISVEDPPLVWREVDGEWVKVPNYRESYAAARKRVRMAYLGGFAAKPDGWYERAEPLAA